VVKYAEGIGRISTFQITCQNYFLTGIYAPMKPFLRKS